MFNLRDLKQDSYKLCSLKKKKSIIALRKHCHIFYRIEWNTFIDPTVGNDEKSNIVIRNGLKWTSVFCSHSRNRGATRVFVHMGLCSF